MELLQRVERYLRRSGMTATRFGREALRDPRLVWDLRNGREPRPPTASRIRDFIAAREQGAGR